MLRLKYHKTTLFLTCQPTTSTSSLKADFLSAVRATNQPELSTLPQYSQPDGKSYPAWDQMDAEQDIGLFIASSTGADETMTIFMPLDQDTTQQSDLSVRKAGLKDSDAVCVGFRAQGAGKCGCGPICYTTLSSFSLTVGSSLWLPHSSLFLLQSPPAPTASISQPIVQFTDVEEDQDEAAVDPDSIPPPLSDE